MVCDGLWNAQHGVGASAQDGDGESADSEKTLLQYYWVRPYEPEQTDLTVIDHNAIMARVDKEHRRGQVPAEAVKELALNRANSVKQALVGKYSLAPERLLVDGLGWDRPADADNAFDHAKNRRVEIKVYPAEKE